MEQQRKQPGVELPRETTEQVGGGLVDNPFETPPDPSFPDCIPFGPPGGPVPAP